ncbi:MAG TPA: DUF2339 domain-containing protein [Gemmatimonadales bacterium]|jgi:hypothetical protein
MPQPESPDIAELVRRIAALESAVEQLNASRVAVRPNEPRPLAPARPAEAATPPRPRPLPPTLITQMQRDKSEIDWEQWFGSRGLLIVGVVALLIAGAFFFKYAIDHGWIAPWVRVISGLIAGAVLAWFGERQARRGLRSYGLAMIGAGGGLIYLAIWAAAGPYAMIGRQAGTILLAAATAAVAWRAAEHDAESLAIWAVVGAFIAPIFLRAPQPRYELLLAYTAVVAYASGALSHGRSWRRAFGVTVLAYFALTPVLAWSIMPEVPGLAYITLGFLALLRITRQHPWPESRVIGFLIAWTVILVAATENHPEAQHAALVAAAAIMMVAGWWDARRDPLFRVNEIGLEGHETVSHQSALFVLGPAAFCLAAGISRPGILNSSPELATVSVSALYLLTGWRGRWAPFVALGFALMATAIAQQWNGSMLVIEWSGVALLTVLAERKLDQRGGPPIGLAVATLGLVDLIGGLLDELNGSAFTGSWSVALYLYAAAIAVAAWAWPRRADAPAWHQKGAGLLWTELGVALLVGGTALLDHFFAARISYWSAAELAGDLAISIYWLVFAAILVRIGFWLDRGVVRSAGLVVAALAIVKVGLFDLSRLEALYRVASFFGLALITLGLAYAYNRRLKRAAERTIT